MSATEEPRDPTVAMLPIIERDTACLTEVPDFEVIPVEGCVSSSNVLGF
ncbi:hypothetical protein [Pandoraea communis]|nr:hypothetical protein [Pandoraea communis]MDM8354847.1 hypothetical protein [Pandoraea communis]